MLISNLGQQLFRDTNFCLGLRIYYAYLSVGERGSELVTETTTVAEIVTLLNPYIVRSQPFQLAPSLV
jgi:hypothetical protein